MRGEIALLIPDPSASRKGLQSRLPYRTPTRPYEYSVSILSLNALFVPSGTLGQWTTGYC